VSIIKYLLNNFNGTLILDAGGLRSLAQISIEEINQRGCELVLTPHLGEIKALYCEYKKPLDVIDYAKMINSVVLLKGNATIITDGKSTIITDTGCPGMAKGGSGDVLSGVIAGLVASKEKEASLLEIVSLGAYVNGIAGEIAQRELCDISMCASDTARNIGRAIAEIKNN
jgi:NAD(P)H-hydrate epimerase